MTKSSNDNSLEGHCERTPAANSTFAIGGVSCSADSLVVAESFVLRIKFSGKNLAHRKSANRVCLESPLIMANKGRMLYKT